jgi:hypothetical protein
MEEYALNKVGEKYSQIQAVQSFFEQPKADKLWQCAELVRNFLAQYSIILKSKPTPANIVKELQEFGKEVKFVKLGFPHQ